MAQNSTDFLYFAFMKRPITYLLTALFLILRVAGFSQNIFPPITNYTSADYGSEFAPENLGICQDSKGVMYFGNTGNILTYDGSRWGAIPVVPTRVCHALHYSSEGTIFVGVMGDFGYLKPNSKGQFSYHSLVDSTVRAKTPFNEVWSIYENDEGVFFHSEEQIFLYKENKVHLLDMPSTAHTVFEVDGKIIARMRGIGLMTWENNQWNKVQGSDLFELFGVFGIVKGHEKSTQIIVTQEVGLYQWNTKQNIISEISSSNDEALMEYLIFGAQNINNDRISLLTKGKGLIIVDKQGRELGRIDKRMGLISNDISQQFTDEDGNLWITTANGISLINLESRLSYFSNEQGIHGGVEAVAHQKVNGKDFLFVGTNEGLFRLNHENKSLSRIFEKIEGINYQVWDIDIYQHRLFVSTSEGLYTADLTEEPFSIKKTTPYNTNSTYIDEENQILVTGGLNGIYIYHLLSMDLLYSIKENLTTITGIEKSSKDNMSHYWIGIHGQGVLKIRKGQNYTYEMFSGVDSGLPSDHIVVPQKLNGEVVLGSTEGILNIDETELDGEIYTFFMPQEFGDSTINNALFYLHDDEAHTWYCIENNVGVYNKNEKSFTNRPFWGIKKGRINTLYHSHEEPYLWIGASDGLIRYDINGQVPFKNNFNAIIRGIYGRNKEMLFGGNPHDAIEDIEIEYNKSFLRIQFSAPYFEDHQPLEFSYFLEGYDEHWSVWSNKNEIDFSNLPDGHYTFKVKARNVYLQESAIDHISFTVLTPWYKTAWAIIGYIILLVFIIYIVVRIASYRLKQQNKRLEIAVTERTKEIAEKNTRLEEQKSEILTQKTEIEDSINYAQRIQNAILPIKEEMLEQLGDSFILFWPKDVVSGDFYWYYKRNNISVVVCADCTGHGVPGAFMSMIGVDKLNVCVGEKGITNPAKILSFLNEGIKTSLRQDESKKATRDGMDAAILTINHDDNTIQYAGAHRSLWLIQNEELEEIKATKVAVGGFTPSDQEYELHEFKLETTTRFYMSSDGYADQFGGPKGKKFMVKKMKKLILEHHLMPMEKQQEALEKAMKEWAENEEQIDDICVIGIAIEIP
nr:SpoIIE family protein phosphatase [uncultured Brumimicrobium sp.]